MCRRSHPQAEVECLRWLIFILSKQSYCDRLLELSSKRSQ
ncbi:hypothetical protein S7335_992 [Synechococcus sp. PCC 7335]|nr:hypothetical protein S7335_992 [Synechococcus sp. PCC 7335]